MKSPKVISTLIFVIAFFCAASAQEKIKAHLADDYFNKFSYISAAPIYEDLATRKEKNIHYVSRAAECYRLLGNTAKAEEWYAKLTALDSVATSDILMYAEMLEGNKKYAEAQKYYAMYDAKKGTDSRAKRKIINSDQMSSFYKDSAYYSISNLPFNSENADFGMFPFGEKSFFFSSNRKREKDDNVKHVYTWNNQPFLDLYIVRKNDDNTFAKPDPIPGEVNSQYHEGPLFFDANTNTFYITRNNYNDKKFQKSKDGINKLKLYIVNIDGTANKSFADFDYNNNEYSVGHATVSDDEKRLYFSSDMPGGFGGTDIYVSVKEDGKWTQPKNLGAEINTEGNEMFPFITADDRLYFSSNGLSGLGGLDIYSADVSRGEVKGIKNMGSPINSNKDDFSFYIFPDKKSGYFSSNREGGKGDDDIYSFLKIKRDIILKGIVTDEITNKVLPGAKVLLKTGTDNVIKEIIADTNGAYSAKLNENSDYVISASKEKYRGSNGSVSTKNISSDKQLIEKNLKLMPDVGFNLIAIITDKPTQKPLPGVKITLTNNLTNSKEELTTNDEGKIARVLSDNKLNDNISYQIKVEREGYLAKTETYNKQLLKPGDYLAHLDLDLSLSPLEKGLDIGKIYDLKPIYFDLGKWNIRADAKKELDKIVKAMNDNPTIVVELGSHTDCRSSAQSNMILSDKRAKSSASYIISQGIDKTRIYGKGYGEAQLLNNCGCEGDQKSNCSETEHQQNRRTEFKVVKF